MSHEPIPSPTRPVAPRRKFTLLDGLILIAPMAAGFAMVRPFLRDRADLYGVSTDSPGWLKYAGLAVNLASRFVAMGMIGVLIARLLPPRPGLRRASRQPGAVACAAGVAAMVMGGLIVGAVVSFRERSTQSGISGWAFFEARIGPAVVVSWAALALSGRWRPEPSWVDRAGRALGAYWIALFLFRWAVGLYWGSTLWVEPF